MHETIGQKQHHGRVALADLLDRPHLYGIVAVPRELLVGCQY